MSEDRLTDGRPAAEQIKLLEARVEALRNALAEALEENRRLHERAAARFMEDLLP